MMKYQHLEYEYDSIPELYTYNAKFSITRQRNSLQKKNDVR